MKEVLFIDNKGRIHGKCNDSNLKKLPWHKRLWAKVNKKYRAKFISIDPVKLENIYEYPKN